jgi:cytochrome c2
MNALGASPASSRRIRILVVVLLWAGTLTGAFATGVYVHKHRARIRAILSSVQGGGVIPTNLYTLRVEKLAVPAEGRDGGIAALEDGILFSNRKGAVWFIDSAKALRSLSLKVPINIDEFESDPFNENTIHRQNFAVKDILVQQIPGGIRILASHNHWFRDDACNTLRVSSMETTQDALLSGESAGTWRTVFDTKPCIALPELPNGAGRNPSLGAGGRLVAISDDEILFSVGGMGPETKLASTATEESGSYGTTTLLNLATGESRTYTLGHRNPQGLAVSSGSEVWLTEHAARGGDELNRIVDGTHYGFPKVSYGTEYGQLTWPSNPRQGRHDGFAKPMLSWVPSIGVSQMIVLEGDRFPYWKGDLLVSSLGAQSLYRVRVEDDRVIFVEPIPVGHRIRDIIEAADGSIVLKADDDFLVYLTPVDAASAADPALDPAERGAILAAQCQGCHTFGAGPGGGIGPGLWGVAGRSVASADGFSYSEGLRSVGGRWSEDALRSFLRDPAAFAPGTSMTMTTTYDERQISDLIAYLESLR